MKLKEVIKEFENDVTNQIKLEVIQNDGNMEPNVFFLTTDEEGNCDIVRKTIPPTPIDIFKNPSFEGIMKLMFHKFMWQSLLNEIKENNKQVLHFIQTERVDFEDKIVLSIVRKQNENDDIPVDTTFYEIIEHDIVVLENGELKPSSVELVEMEQD